MIIQNINNAVSEIDKPIVNYRKAAKFILAYLIIPILKFSFQQN